MTPQCIGRQTVEEIYELLRSAGVGRRPIAAVYKGLARLFCPHVLGRSKQGRLHAFCYQFGGASERGLPATADGVGGWRCIAVEKLSHVELCGGRWRTAPRSGKQTCVERVEFDADAQAEDPQNGQ
jgi:hypothetical protein